MTCFSCMRSALLAMALAVLWAPFAGAEGEAFDVIFSGGSVMDGSGTPAVRADVGIRDGVIAAVGDLTNAAAARRVDVAGKTLVPGFIDLHSHADGAGEGGGLRSRDDKRRAAPNLVAQGVTTVVVNQDGRSPIDIGRQRDRLEQLGFGPNTVLMVGHNSIRGKVLAGKSRRPSNDDEIAKMVELVREGMEAGAYGLSAGLEYVPGIWSDTRELIALVGAVKPYNGVYIVHERSSGRDPMWYTPSQDAPNPPTMLDNIHEVIAVAETTGVTSVATHIKARGADFWGASGDMIATINNARANGVPVWADQYPYNTSGSDGATVLIPEWVVEKFGENSEDYVGALERVLDNPEQAALLRGDVAHKLSRRGGPDNVIIFDYPDTALIGKSLSDVALIKEMNPIELIFQLQLDGYADRAGGARLRGFSMSEKDVEAFAAQPWCMTASDAGIALVEDGPVHARYYGTFPRKIHEYARKRGVLTVEQAIRSMTSLPAEVLRFERRGLLREGFYADITVLDLDVLEDTATFFNPHRFPEGVDYVMANGAFLVDGGELTYALPGQILTPANSQANHNTDD